MDLAIEPRSELSYGEKNSQNVSDPWLLIGDREQVEKCSHQGGLAGSIGKACDS